MLVLTFRLLQCEMFAETEFIFQRNVRAFQCDYMDDVLSRE